MNLQIPTDAIAVIDDEGIQVSFTELDDVQILALSEAFMEMLFYLRASQETRNELDRIRRAGL